MRIFGIDPGNTTGWAAIHGANISSGVVELHHDPKVPGLRLQFFYDWLGKKLGQHLPDILAYEDASFGSINRKVRSSHDMLCGIIHLIGHKYHLPVFNYTPTEIKKFATGHGTAEKSDMINACRQELNIDPVDDNEADALWVASLANTTWKKRLR